MKHVLFWVLLVVLLLATVRALADREGRARAVFEDRCAACHVVGWGAAQKTRPGIVDLTTTVKKHDLEWVREWITNPLAKKSDTLCRAGRLEKVQIDLLVGFLNNHAKTISRKMVVPQKVLKQPQERAP